MLQLLARFLTEAVVCKLLLCLTAAADVLDEEVDVTEDDEGRGQDGAQLILQHQAVTLELPHLVGHGVHLHKGVAEKHT